MHFYSGPMTKKKNTQRGRTSFGHLIRNLRARARKIELAKTIVPDDIADDPRAMLEWIREQDRRERRRKKWE
jgi:hypothetical protein